MTNKRKNRSMRTFAKAICTQAIEAARASSASAAVTSRAAAAQNAAYERAISAERQWVEAVHLERWAQCLDLLGSRSSEAGAGNVRFKVEPISPYVQAWRSLEESLAFAFREQSTHNEVRSPARSWLPVQPSEKAARIFGASQRV